MQCGSAQVTPDSDDILADGGRWAALATSALVACLSSAYQLPFPGSPKNSTNRSSAHAGRKERSSFAPVN
jgi:hypothetical protein